MKRDVIPMFVVNILTLIYLWSEATYPFPGVLSGSPSVMCSKEKLKTEVFEDLSMTKRQDICLSLFHLLNWFRELVSPYLIWGDVRSASLPYYRCVRLLVRQMLT